MSSQITRPIPQFVTVAAALGCVGLVATAADIYRDQKNYKKNHEIGRQLANQWDGRTPVECAFEGGKQIVRVDGFNDLQILDMRNRIVTRGCNPQDATP